MLRLRGVRAEWPRRYWLSIPIELPAHTTIEVGTVPGDPDAVSAGSGGRRRSLSFVSGAVRHHFDLSTAFPAGKIRFAQDIEQAGQITIVEMDEACGGGGPWSPLSRGESYRPAARGSASAAPLRRAPRPPAQAPQVEVVES